MNNLQRGVINIVCSALTGKKVSLPEDFSLSDGLEIARKHKIEVLFYYGALNCGFSQEEPLMQELFMLVCGNIAVNEQQMYAVKEIFSAFDEQKIDYLPLKGTVIKELYPKPEMRSMGDADILIKTEQYDKIKPVMRSLGYTEGKESDHELVWYKGKINIELHKQLFSSYNKDFGGYFGDGWNFAELNNCTYYSMTDENQMIYLFTHFAKHYRAPGIGIKHMTDLWVYRQSKLDMNEKYIKKELLHLKLYDFYVNVLHTLEAWFEGRESDEIIDFITETVFNSGVFGTHEVLLLSGALKNSRSVGSVKKSRRRRIFKILFPSYDSMCQKYSFLKKAPFLMPFLWVVRGFDIALFNRSKIKAVDEDLKRITEESVMDYERALKFVGLDYNFEE